jgi:transposase-like protein
MDTYNNASLAPRGREAMARGVVEGGLSKAAAARRFNTTPKTVGEWVARFRAEGPAGLMDRSCRRHDRQRLKFSLTRSAKALHRLRLKHLRSKPYTPKTNGKAERFVQTSLRDWAYARAHDTSDQRAAELPSWLHHYNWHRPHGGIGAKPPISRIALTKDNVLRLHS